MNLEIIKSQSPKRIKKLYDIIINNKICFNGGGIQYAGLSNIICISIGFVNNTPVACAITYKPRSIFYAYNIAAYTKPEYRGKKIQDKLVPTVVKKTLKLYPDIKFRTSENNFYKKYIGDKIE